MKVHIKYPDNSVSACGRVITDATANWTGDLKDATCKTCVKVYKTDQDEMGDVDTNIATPNELRNKAGLCCNCHRVIQVAIFKGGRYCSDDCRKALGEDIE